MKIIDYSDRIFATLGDIVVVENKKLLKSASEGEKSFYFKKNILNDEHSFLNKQARILKSIRKQKGYTLYDLSELSGLSPSYISRIEAGNRRLNSETIRKFSLALGCSEDSFFKNDNVEKIVEEVVSENGFKKNLPVYRVVGEGVDITDNKHSVIILNAAMEYTFRPPKLSFSETGFAIYAGNNLNAPVYNFGDMLYFDSVSSYKVGETIMVIDKDCYVFIGQLLNTSDNVMMLSTYSNGEVFEFEVSLISKMFKLVAVEFQ